LEYCAAAERLMPDKAASLIKYPLKIVGDISKACGNPGTEMSGAAITSARRIDALNLSLTA
jgi:hypothetical protein